MLPIINDKQHFSLDLITRLESKKTASHYKRSKYGKEKLEIVSVIVLLILANRFCVFQIICQKTINHNDDTKPIVSSIFIRNMFMLHIIVPLKYLSFDICEATLLETYLAWRTESL